MARQLNRLTARTIATCKNPGRHADGQNLYLKVSRTADGLSKSWVFMYVFAARQREAGLGSASAVTLAQAREKAAEYRSMLAKGIVIHSTQSRPPRRPMASAGHLANALTS
jgi:hypothetical protein